MKNIYRHIRQILCLIGLMLIGAQASQAQDEWVWEQVTPMLQARMGHCSVPFEGKIYVFGGLIQRRQAEVTDRTEIYDPVEDIWSEGEPLPAALFQATAVSNGRYIYIMGGTVPGGGPNGDIFVFNPQSNRYSRLDRLPAPRWAMGSVKIGRRLLIIGGISGRQDYHSDGYWWDIDSLGWTSAPRLNQPSAGFGLAFNGMVWAVGGMSFGPMNRVEVLNLQRQEWELLPRSKFLPEPRGELGVSFLEDTLLIAAGGIGNHGAAADVFMLATNDTLGWTRLPNLLQSRAEFSLITLFDRVYAIGGGTGGGERLNMILTSVEVLRRANGISDETGRSSIRQTSVDIWPNPANSSYTISLPSSVVKYQLIDTNGRLIFDRFPASTAMTISENISNLPAGRYQVITFDAGGIGRSAGGLTVVK